MNSYHQKYFFCAAFLTNPGLKYHVIKLLGLKFTIMTQLVNFSSRKFAVILLTLVITISPAQALSGKVSCEKVESVNWNNVNAQRTCYMDRVTTIDTPNFGIQDSLDETIGGLRFYMNTKISFLPIKVFKSFPNVVVYNAEGCSVKTTSRENFEKLGKLKVLLLNDNEIEKLEAYVFDELVSLEWLVLRKRMAGFHCE